MKKILVVSSILIALFVFIGCGKEKSHMESGHDHSKHQMEGTSHEMKESAHGAHQQAGLYVCPMKCPGGVSDTPASCPKCGMDLVKK